MNWLEAVAVVFGVVAVALTIKQNLWCWPAGLFTGLSLYVFVFYEARLYSDMVLHVIYVTLDIIRRQTRTGGRVDVARHFRSRVFRSSRPLAGRRSSRLQRSCGAR